MSGNLSNPFAKLRADGLPSGPTARPASRQETRPPKPSKLGRVVLRRETAHRGGKTVTIVYDFAPNIAAAYIEALGKKLKAACGCGGTVKGREIEIQGEQAAKIRVLLEPEGFRVAGVT
ncbi:MAG: translation initiation factor [Chloroflexi bacterium]|nr:translation initiation factor [Chloroflexota bacterium]